MEGLRGLAILLVFLCHYKIVILDRLSPAFSSAFFETTVQIGGTGVDLFFLLSGMLIYGPLCGATCTSASSWRVEFNAFIQRSW